MSKFSLRYVRACLAWAVLHTWPSPLPRWMFWILPACGDYAYWDELVAASTPADGGA